MIYFDFCIFLGPNHPIHYLCRHWFHLIAPWTRALSHCYFPGFFFVTVDSNLEFAYLLSDCVQENVCDFGYKIAFDSHASP